MGGVSSFCQPVVDTNLQILCHRKSNDTRMVRKGLVERPNFARFTYDVGEIRGHCRNGGRMSGSFNSSGFQHVLG